MTIAAMPGSAGTTASKGPASVTAISPIFGQLVAFSQPVGFIVAFEKPSPQSYIREAVPKGETVERWSQMITVTGAKGASNGGATPRDVAGHMAGGFKQACPETYAAEPIGELKVGSYDAFAAVMGCGLVKSAADKHSETALVVAIKGASDYYTIQWAERGAVLAGPPAVADAKWKQRLDALGPIRLCAIVPGEKAPFPSCLGGG